MLKRSMHEASPHSHTISNALAPPRSSWSWSMRSLTSRKSASLAPTLSLWRLKSEDLRGSRYARQHPTLQRPRSRRAPRQARPRCGRGERRSGTNSAASGHARTLRATAESARCTPDRRIRRGTASFLRGRARLVVLELLVRRTERDLVPRGPRRAVRRQIVVGHRRAISHDGRRETCERPHGFAIVG